jgi:hypothetical protein
MVREAIAKAMPTLRYAISAINPAMHPFAIPAKQPVLHPLLQPLPELPQQLSVLSSLVIRSRKTCIVCHSTVLVVTAKPQSHLYVEEVINPAQLATQVQPRAPLQLPLSAPPQLPQSAPPQLPQPAL